MRLLAVGRGRASPEAEMVSRYAKRIKPSLEIMEFDDGHGAAVEIKRREAAMLLAAIDKGDFVVALDQDGAAPDSAGFAKSLTRWSETGKRLNFVIGGAEGLDGAVLARADTTLSLGKLTWPHMLVRAMLAEQIFRAQMINLGHPYHRAGRP